MPLTDVGATTDRALDLVRKARREGLRPMASQVALRAYGRWKDHGLSAHLAAQDVADSTTLVLPPPPRLEPGRPATIGWVCSPPRRGSGGHTTLFRMVAALQAHGHRCVVFLHDTYGGDFDRHRRAMARDWPGVQVEVRDAERGLTGVDACVATSWESAHVLASRAREPMHLLYFLQDYEPYFFPRGSLAALAEDTYRFGFQMISLGDSVADIVRREIGVPVEVVPFGCDTDTYRLLPGDRARHGVVCFARPDVPRRGFHLAMLALEDFHRLRPEQEIHLYGERVRDLRFPATQHGGLRPDELNALYNRTLGGLALSFTNITLVVEEMLSAGCIPVANRNEIAAASLHNEQIRWSEPTPRALADALAAVVSAPEPAARARAASAAPVVSWDSTARAICARVDAVLWGAT